MRFDHVVVAVRDLDDATRRCAAAGLEVRPGGRHLGIGTENAIVRFGLDYIELITVHDATQAAQANARSRELCEYLGRYEAGFVGFALASDDLEAVAARLRAIGQDVLGPTPMRRRRPDGIVLEWSLAIPGAVAWRRPWPFFISWALPDGERLTVEPPDVHPNGAAGVSGISVAVRDLSRARALYEAAVGPVDGGPERFTVALGEVEIQVVGANDEAARGLDRGDGPYELRLRSRDGSGWIREILPSVVIRLE